MRLYTVVLFLLCVSLVNALVVEMEIFPEGTGTSMSDGDKYSKEARNLSSDMTEVSGDVSPEAGINFGLIGFALKAGGILLTTFTFFIFGFYDMLKGCGVPEAIAFMLQTIAFFIMAVGAFQLLTGRGMKGYE